MTNEELITGLRHISHTMERNGHSYYQHVAEEAIKALEQKNVLDKIRAEIAELQLIGYATVNGEREIASRAVMQILDKHKAESEDKE